MKATLTAFAERGAPLAVMVGWKPGSLTNIGSLALHYGFEALTEIQRYWYNDSKLKGYKCPHCGEPPCTCSAVLYAKHMG